MISRYRPRQNGRPYYSFLLYGAFSSSSITAADYHLTLTPRLVKQCKTQHQVSLLHQQSLVRGLTSSLSISLLFSYATLHAYTNAILLLQAFSPSGHLVHYWNILIRNAISLGEPARCLSLYGCMKTLGWSPDQYTYPYVLKACGGSIKIGRSVHAGVIACGFESNVFVCNAIVAMYGRSGALGDARTAFDELCERSVVDLASWNSIVTCYVQCEDSNTALRLFDRMLKIGDEELRPDVISLLNVLPACAALKKEKTGKEIHGYAVRSRLLENVFVGNALVDLYAKCGMMEDAEKLFARMTDKDVVSWNVMVTGYSQVGRFENALGLFDKMREGGIELDVVSWSAVIAGYAQRGHGDEALKVFKQMQECQCLPNQVTLVSVLSGCASVGALSLGKEIHCYAIKSVLRSRESYSDDDLLVVNALIDMYSKCENIHLATNLFNSIAIQDKDVATWTVMIGGHAQHGEASDAIKLFSSMIRQSSLVRPNYYTISCSLLACTRLGALRLGKEVHAYMIRHQQGSDVLFVTNCLIDMYCKSGHIGAARVVFDRMERKNAVSWTSLITGYGMYGFGTDALDLFNEMQREGFPPDEINFLVVLYACNHSGMVDQGVQYFEDMKALGLPPREEHFACMVDILGRAGRVSQAMKLIEEMPMKATSVIWATLLGSCRLHGQVELGEYAAKKLLELNYQNDGAYTLLSNLYANANRWKDVARVRLMMKNTGIKKRPGCSWVQGKTGFVTFFAGDRSHSLSSEIYGLLAYWMRLIKGLGYVPATRFALHDVDDEEKGKLLAEHSEKLAVAYGILTSTPGSPIRITKNLRICGDCHDAITYISMIVEHEIILRDSSRFHHFKKGKCSCNGYW